MVYGVLFSVLLTAVQPAGNDERAATIAALQSYFNEIHGGTGIAFPAQRRPILLHPTTIVPAVSEIEVRVSSPANREAARQYASPQVRQLAGRLRRPGVQPRAVPVSLGYALAAARMTECGPQFDDRTFTDAVAVSRPAFRGREAALIYLEYAGGARAYFVIRHGERWKADWYVELWACG